MKRCQSVRGVWEWVGSDRELKLTFRRERDSLFRSSLPIPSWKFRYFFSSWTFSFYLPFVFVMIKQGIKAWHSRNEVIQEAEQEKKNRLNLKRSDILPQPKWSKSNDGLNLMKEKTLLRESAWRRMQSFRGQLMFVIVVVLSEKFSGSRNE